MKLLRKLFPKKKPKQPELFFEWVEIPEEPTKPTPVKPSTPEKAPKTSVERPNGKMAQSTTVSYKLDSEAKEVANMPVYSATLPRRRRQIIK